jgi:hypothetical protein
MEGVAFMHCAAGFFFALMREAANIKAALQSYLQTKQPLIPAVLKVQTEILLERTRELVRVSLNSECISVAAVLIHLTGNLSKQFEPTPNTLVALDELVLFCEALSLTNASSAAILSPLSTKLIYDWKARTMPVVSAGSEVAKLGGKIAVAKVLWPCVVGLERTVLNVQDAMKVALATQTMPPSVARDAVVLQYLVEAEVDIVFRKALSDLFSTALSVNPYASLTCTLKTASIMFAQWKYPDHYYTNALVNRLSPAPVLTNATNLCGCWSCVKGDANLIGSQQALLVANIKLAQSTARDLFRPDVMLVPLISVSVPAAYSLQPTLCLAGDCRLWGTLVDFVSFVTLNHSILIEGPKSSVAIELFAQQVMPG